MAALVAHAIRQQDTNEAEQILAQYQKVDASPSFKVMLSKLQAVLRGARDPALAADPALDYDDAAELVLLLEGLP